ncbi:hypothetical protein [Frigoribacterium sp. RIT-PI-h]|uniref:CBU_0592 family membrane protein n=1 Tax=Frigoribacterium sp. RIT-PI-h TaxID=1690245 RepID=UPI0006B8B997|nr:hypothetical protein [Frigoribacterium sp. RIT-PI-h]
MVFEVLGWVGAVVVLAGYALFSLGKLPNGPVYQLANLVGSVCISINVASHGALPSTIVNALWAIIAAIVLVRMARRPRRTARAVASTSGVPLAVAAEPTMQPTTQPVPLMDSVPVITAALAVVTLAAMEHAQHTQQASETHAPRPQTEAVA